MKIEDDDQLVTVFETASRLNRKVSTIRKDIYLKKFPTVKIGRSIRIPLSAIRGMIAAGYRPAAR